jgi:Flp pilus assembly pilin Flp
VQSQYDADYWRQRAEEARAAAQSMILPAAKREMHFIAQAYERLADRAELAAGRISDGGQRCVAMFARIWRDQRGASLIDYTILVALITALVVAGIAVAGSWVQGMWMRLLPMLG